MRGRYAGAFAIRQLEGDLFRVRSCSKLRLPCSDLLVATAVAFWATLLSSSSFIPTLTASTSSTAVTTAFGITSISEKNGASRKVSMRAILLANAAAIFVGHACYLEPHCTASSALPQGAILTVCMIGSSARYCGVIKIDTDGCERRRDGINFSTIGQLAFGAQLARVLPAPVA